MRDCVTYFSPDWKKGCEAIYLGGITEMVRMARRKRGVRSAGVRGQPASPPREMTASLLTVDHDALKQMKRWWYILRDALDVTAL